MYDIQTRCSRAELLGYREWEFQGRIYKFPIYSVTQRPPTDSEIKKDHESAEMEVRRFVSGAHKSYKEPDWTGRRFKVFDRDMEREFKEEYPDWKIKFRKRRYW